MFRAVCYLPSSFFPFYFHLFFTTHYYFLDLTFHSFLDFISTVLPFRLSSGFLLSFECLLSVFLVGPLSLVFIELSVVIRLRICFFGKNLNSFIFISFSELIITSSI